MSDLNNRRRIMICAPSSGSGKTLITCALLKILLRQGYNPASFKCGPDYIDPMFHRTVLGIPSRNLDMFLTPGDGVCGPLFKGLMGRDFGVLEGVMGFFDGISLGSTEGSSYEISCVTDTPAILVVNARGMSTSVVPLIKGFCDYGKKKRIQGIILNNVSPSVAEAVSKLIHEETGVKVIGFLPVLKDIEIKSRHLGLVMPDEMPDVLETIEKVADRFEENLNFEELLRIAESAGEITQGADPENRPRRHVPTVRIGVARDEAFSFYYEDNLELLQELGAEPVFFSPLHDDRIPDVSRLIIGGGYPELYAKELSQNHSMLQSIKDAADNGMPILAECGGFLYLLESLTDPEGKEYPMTGVFTGGSHMTDKLSHFGYVRVTKNLDNPYLMDGEEIRGHEFHYYKADKDGEDLKMTKPKGDRYWTGCRTYKNVLGGFPHLYYPSCGPFIQRFIDA